MVEVVSWKELGKFGLGWEFVVLCDKEGNKVLVGVNLEFWRLW